MIFRYETDRPLPSNVGSMTVQCEFCKALKWPGETEGLCCEKGKVKIPLLPKPPEPLASLLLGQHQGSAHFLGNIRSYNSAFQMTSMGCKQVSFLGQWNPCFRIQGQVYHLIGSLEPSQDGQNKFAQIYFVDDPSDQAGLRCAAIPGLTPATVIDLQMMLQAQNSYVRSFHFAREMLSRNSESLKVVIDADKRPTGEHERRYNAPQTNEVAVLMLDEKHGNRDIVLKHREGGLQRIAETHRSYDPLQYPLLFPRGKDGWSIELLATKGKKLTPMKFYAFLMMFRPDPDFNTLLRCGKLMQQFIVDMYVKIESDRLNFLRHNQKKLRAENYSEFSDALSRQDADPANIGKKVILPSSFTGGPRYMNQRVQDAMAYVRKFGRPTYFITQTCNPSWPEIVQHLLPGQAAHQRPDIVARVFHLKLTEMMDDLTKECIFGPVRAHLHCVEWQKRGLPHAHILLWLESSCRVYGDTIDKVISAEIPSKQENPVLHDIVMRNMIHGPCGRLNPQCVCMKDNFCSKNFPKDFISETICADDGYPLYRRRKPCEGGHTGVKKVRGKNVTVDNRFVVPYSPYLCEKYDCHINVEVCNSINAIKYVIKYVNKGNDMAAFAFQRHNPSDEIDIFQAARYVSCSEACWRIFGYHIHKHYPAVINLQVHLPNGQRVLFTPENAQDKAQHPPKTTLTAFFALCQRYHSPQTRNIISADRKFVKNLLSSNVPQYFTFVDKGKVWKPRIRGSAPVLNADGEMTSFKSSSAIGRVYNVHPRQAECFFLRLLLHHQTGCCSFENLRTVDGNLYPSFREACRALGLLEDDAHWRTAMEEASAHASPHSLRVLFSILLTSCQLADPLHLWETHKNSMTEDLLHRYRQATREFDAPFTPALYNDALIRIEDIVHEISGDNLTHFGLPTTNRTHSDSAASDYARETAYDVAVLQQFLDENEENLTVDQRIIYDRIIQLIDEKRGGFLFIDAPGGTGKTYLAKMALSRIRSQRLIALATASSGIASQLLPNGRTSHSTFKIPLDLTSSDQPMCNIKKGTQTAKLIKECSAVFWDESTMMNRVALEAVDRTFRDIRDCQKIFGGVLFVLSGDFRETLPVIRGGTRANEIHSYLKSSPLWHYVETHSLTTNMRVHLHNDLNAAAFSNLLLTVGDGRIPCTVDTQTITVPEELCHIVSTDDELFDKVYDNLEDNHANIDWLMERAILAPLNETVNAINNILLNRFPGNDVKTYNAIDSVPNEDDATQYPLEFLNSLQPSGMPPYQLRLKIGLPVMVLRNLAPGIANGTRLIIRKTMERCLETVISTGSRKGEILYLPMISLTPSDTGLPFTFTRRQFPIKPAMAMTINKSQGQTLKVAGLELQDPCFSHGQFYVACSRVSSNSNLFIHVNTPSTRNVVYHEVLS